MYVNASNGIAKLDHAATWIRTFVVDNDPEHLRAARS